MSKPSWCYVPQDINFQQKNIAACLGIAKLLSMQQFAIRCDFAVQLKPYRSSLTSYFTNVIFRILWETWKLLTIVETYSAFAISVLTFPNNIVVVID